MTPAWAAVASPVEGVALVAFALDGRRGVTRGALAVLWRVAGRHFAPCLARDRVFGVAQLPDFDRLRAAGVCVCVFACEEATVNLTPPADTGAPWATAAPAEPPMAAQTAIGVAMAMRVPGRCTLWLSAVSRFLLRL
jgi:hypothetical protein